MKKTFHVCLSAGEDGLLCREEMDYIRLVNAICMSACHTDSSLLAYAVMSNHVHLCVRSEDVQVFIRKWRYMYSRYFNSRYERRGRLGEKVPFMLELNGRHHTLTAIAYVLRNPLHHGVAATPFGYRFSSVNAVFRKEMGRKPEKVLAGKSMYRFMPEAMECPSRYKMAEDGLLLPESVIDVADVEHMFVTARSYLYYMNRLSGRKWEEEQMQDGLNVPPVTLESLENGIADDLQKLLTNEFGRADYNAMSDIDLCGIIDKDCVVRYGAPSVYRLDDKARSAIAARLVSECHVPRLQVKRCLAM